MYTSYVRFEWDETKREANIAKHGIDFSDVSEMFSSLMLVGPDSRKDYGETRKIGFGLIRGRLMVVAFTGREPNSIRIISARKANKREEAYYQEAVAVELGKN
ncbi:MAG: BrnT family toxin [Nitrospira sp.]|nr:BrnT family toxin [Nitrospira sp.]